MCAMKSCDNSGDTASDKSPQPDPAASKCQRQHQVGTVKSQMSCAKIRFQPKHSPFFSRPNSRPLQLQLQLLLLLLLTVTLLSTAWHWHQLRQQCPLQQQLALVSARLHLLESRVQRQQLLQNYQRFRIRRSVDHPLRTIDNVAILDQPSIVAPGAGRRSIGLSLYSTLSRDPLTEPTAAPLPPPPTPPPAPPSPPPSQTSSSAHAAPSSSVTSHLDPNQPANLEWRRPEMTQHSQHERQDRSHSDSGRDVFVDQLIDSAEKVDEQDRASATSAAGPGDRVSARVVIPRESGVTDRRFEAAHALEAEQEPAMFSLRPSYHDPATLQNANPLPVAESPSVRLRSQRNHLLSTPNYRRRQRMHNLLQRVKMLEQQLHQQRSPVAGHFEAHVVPADLSQHGQYVGNYRVKNMDANKMHSYWRKSDWMQESAVSGNLSLSTGKLLVQVGGLYYFYAQVNYVGPKTMSGFAVNVNGKSRAHCVVSDGGRHAGKMTTCHLGVLLSISSGDEISIHDLEHHCVSILLPDRTFFGLVRLSNAV